MAQGPEHVEAALKLIESASETIGELDGVEESWRDEAVARLASTTALLRATLDRFFLKTRVCLPFARKCEEEASKLDALLAELGAQPAPDAQQRLGASLQALERAVKTLDERSMMQGMAIT
jgi:hypothetical protein